MSDYRHDFIAFAIASGVLRFGRFVTKSGRTTPYFFDAGLFNTGGRLGRLAEFYADAIQASACPMTWSSAPRTRASRSPPRPRWRFRAAGTTCLTRFNRKETKDHGEGGSVVGAAARGQSADRRRRHDRRDRRARVGRADPRRRRDARGRRGVPRPDGARLGRALRGPGSSRTLRHTGHRDRDAR